MPGERVGRSHGGVRGAEHPHQSLTFEGRFGRIFRALPPARFSEEALTALGQAMTAEHEDAPTPETEVDDEENQGISAGYTYFGQFIDHDLTFDPASRLQKQDDPEALVDFRTPRFDLDNSTAAAPTISPISTRTTICTCSSAVRSPAIPTTSGTRDLPRQPVRERRPRPRADRRSPQRREHHRLPAAGDHAALPQQGGGQAQGAGTCRRSSVSVRWHYQYAVVHDFLPTIVGKDTLYAVLPHLKSGKSILEDKPQLNFYHFKNEPFIPIEFTTAAYRFGHSMVRPIYRLNTTLGQNPPPPAKKDPVNGRQFIFDPSDDNRSLNGFREFPSNWAVEWNLFFDMGNNPPKLGVNRLQRSYKIDSSLVNPLGKLPVQIADKPRSLPVRNLLRGLRMGLPTGQDVARAMGMAPLSDEKLVVGKATEANQHTNKSIVALPKVGHEFEGKAPLWYYVLAEAQQQFKKDDTPIHLGPVGGRIVTETFVGLMLGDSHSYLSQDPSWAPNRQRQFGIADLIAMAINP